MAFKILAALAFSSLFIAAAVRIRIFCKAENDPIASSFLDDTFPTTFTDFLWIHLYRQRGLIDARHRLKITAYFWLTVAAIVLWVAAFCAHWLAA